MFKKLVEERSSGRITVEVFPAAQLGSEVAMVEGLRLGSIDVICANAPNAATVVPELGLFSVAYLFKDIAHFERVVNDPNFAKRIDEIVAGKNLGIKLRRLLRRRRAQHLQPQGLGGQPRRPQGREDPRAEQPGRGEGVEDVRRHPDADELRRGLPGAAVRRARRGRERARGDRVEQALRSGEVRLADRAPAQPLGAATSTRRSSTSLPADLQKIVLRCGAGSRSARAQEGRRVRRGGRRPPEEPRARCSRRRTRRSSSR